MLTCRTIIFFGDWLVRKSICTFTCVRFLYDYIFIHFSGILVSALYFLKNRKIAIDGSAALQVSDYVIVCRFCCGMVSKNYLDQE